MLTSPTPDLSLVTGRLEIIVAGDPVAQARHRDRIVTARDGRSFVARYTPKETTDWRRAVLLAARQTPGFPSEPWEGPVRLSADAYFARPQRLCRKCDPPGRVRKNSDPDADNIVKAIMDALTPPKIKRTGNAAIDEARRRDGRRGYLWVDDGQVHLGPVDRWYAAKGCAPGVVIVVERIAEDDGEKEGAA